VWRLDGSRLLVLTVDVITPIVDSPFEWGRVAAANAVSDVYAMGGRPLLALDIAAWNRDVLGLSGLEEVLRGAAAVAEAAGFALVGGHTIDAEVPTFGLAVVGVVDESALMTNRALEPGVDLVLTKAIGTGLLATALKAGRLSSDGEAALVRSMTTLNADAAAAAWRAGSRAATDVTGFGLLGHARRLAEGSRVDVVLDPDAVERLPGTDEALEAGFIPGGSRRNLAWVREVLDEPGLPEEELLVLADAQTSGGLLFGAAPTRAAEAVRRLRSEGHPAAVVGRVERGTGRVRLEPSVGRPKSD
jgi:selenide,water dikinase